MLDPALVEIATAEKDRAHKEKFYELVNKLIRDNVDDDDDDENKQGRSLTTVFTREQYDQKIAEVETAISNFF